MLHVDEGQLHALLDGAFDEAEAQALHEHISVCAECTAQLEEARALRARSSAILDTAQPARVAMPPFESVLAKSQRLAPSRSVTWFAPRRLAQAAMMVLALGIGWFSRDLAMRADEAALDQVAAPERASAPVTVPPAAPPAAASASEPVGLASTAANEGNAATAARRSEDSRTNALAKVGAYKDAERDEARKALLSAAEAVQASGVGQQRQAQPPPAQQLAQTQQQQSRVQQQNAGARDVQASAARVQAPQPAAAAAQFADAFAPLRWQYMSVQSAEQLTGRSVLRVPELQIINVGVASTPGGYVVLVNQRLDDGAILELQQRPEDQKRERQEAEKLKEEVAADASRSNQVTLQRAGLTITARGFVSADSLRVLVQRMR